MTLEQDRTLMNGKVAVITGGSRGIGLAVGTALVSRGVKVVLGDVLKNEGQEAAERLNKEAGKEVVVFQYCDVRKYDDLKKLFQLAETKFGGVDYAILNAGVSTNHGAINDPMEDENERLIHEINVGGVIKGNKVALMHMVKRKGGVIINTASILGVMGGTGMGAYAATKHAVVGWTRSMDHVQALNIRVNAVCPYWVDTDIIRLANLPDGSRHPFMDVINATPKAPMEYVVDAFLTCIRNEDYMGEALVVTPKGHEVHPRVAVPESCVNESMLQALLEYNPKMIEQTKKDLEAASRSYFSRL